MSHIKGCYKYNSCSQNTKNTDHPIYQENFKQLRPNTFAPLILFKFFFKTSMAEYLNHEKVTKNVMAPKANSKELELSI